MPETPEQIAAREAAAAAANASATEGADDGKDAAGLKQALSATRAEVKAQRAQREALDNELKALKQSRAQEEADRLAKQNDFKGLYEKAETNLKALQEQNQQLAADRKKDFIRFSVAKEFPTLKDHYIENLFPFGKVKLAEGNKLEGFQEAMESFKADNAELLKAFGAAGGGSGGAGGGQQGAESAAEALQRQMREQAEAQRGAGQKKALDFRSAILAGTKKVFGSPS